MTPHPGFISRQGGLAIGAGVQFDNRRAHGFGDRDLDRIRFNKQRDADAGIGQLAHIGRDVIMARSHIQPALGRALLALFRHQADCVRLVTQGDLEHFLGRRHFQVQRQLDLGHQPVDILIRDVTTILAQVCGNAIGTTLGRLARCTHGIGMGATAGIPDGRDMIDIDAET